MSYSLSHLMAYFHDCYHSDNRDGMVNDFLSSRVENKIFFDRQEELINGELPFVTIADGIAAKIVKKLTVFKQEKELIYGSFFIYGQYVDHKGVSRRLCAPLIYVPATVTYREAIPFVAINIKQRKFNWSLLALLSSKSQSDMLKDVDFNGISNDYIHFHDITRIISFCTKFIGELNTKDLLSYPHNVSARVLKERVKEQEQKLDVANTIVPMSMLGIVPKSTNTRGVLNELKALKETPDYSAPLQHIFGTINITLVDSEYTSMQLPMLLSEAQTQLVASARTHPITIISGPPGTGKSYTIGAIAMEHMSRGESVLIVARTDEAVNVVHEKIAQYIGESCMVRAGKKRSYMTPMRRFLKSIITRKLLQKFLLKTFEINCKPHKLGLVYNINALQEVINKQSDRLLHLENKLTTDLENELKWGNQLAKDKQSLWGSIRMRYLKMRNNWQTPIWETTREIEKEDSIWQSNIIQLTKLQYVNRLQSVVNRSWMDLKQFYDALNATSDTEKLHGFEKINFNEILTAFPIWLVKIAEIKDVLPYRKEMFDVAIIDEASQCDVASSLPILQRAKRVVIAGDENQLNHISFLSSELQSNLVRKHGVENYNAFQLDYRNGNLLTCAMRTLYTNDQIALLDEHFRSKPDIINFSNKAFYDNALKYMRSRPDHVHQCLYLIQCNGKRSKDGINEIEGRRLLNDMQILIDKEAGLSSSQCASIGIVSPLKSQVEWITKQLLEMFSIEVIEKHQLKVGTAYQFQGSERDIMFLSFGVTDDCHHAAFNHINKLDVFNVTITRARNEQYVYLSASPNKLPHGSLLKEYVQSIGAKQLSGVTADTSYDQFLVEVTKMLELNGMATIWTGYNVASISIDILIKHKTELYAIDLIGYPGDFEDAHDLDAYRILRRAGIHLFPLPYSDWLFEREATTHALLTFVNHHK